MSFENDVNTQRGGLWTNQVLCQNGCKKLKALGLSVSKLFWFSLTSKHFSNHDKNIKQVSCVKSSKFNGFVLALFCILGLGQNLT